MLVCVFASPSAPCVAWVRVSLGRTDAVESWLQNASITGWQRGGRVGRLQAVTDAPRQQCSSSWENSVANRDELTHLLLPSHCPPVKLSIVVDREIASSIVQVTPPRDAITECERQARRPTNIKYGILTYTILPFMQEPGDP